MTKPPCFNRPAYKNAVIVPDGWTEDGRRKMLLDLDPMSKDCPLIKPPFGEAYLQNWDCDGCHWASGDTATDN